MARLQLLAVRSNTDEMAAHQGAFILFGLLAFYSAVVVGEPYRYMPGSVAILAEPARLSNVIGKSVTFKKCKSEDITDVSSVDITPCDSEPCVFKKGSTVNTTVTFTQKKPQDGGKLEVFGMAFGVKVKLPVDQPDICQGHNLECPLKAGKEYEFHLSMVVKGWFPPVPTTVQADVKDKNGKVVMCIQFKAKVQ